MRYSRERLGRDEESRGMLWRDVSHEAMVAERIETLRSTEESRICKDNGEEGTIQAETHGKGDLTAGVGRFARWSQRRATETGAREWAQRKGPKELKQLAETLIADEVRKVV